MTASAWGAPGAMSAQDLALRDALARSSAEVDDFHRRSVHEPGAARAGFAGVPHALIPTAVVARDLPLALARRDGPESVALVLYELGVLIGRTHAERYFEERAIPAHEQLRRMTAGPAHFAWAGYGDVDLLIVDQHWDERIATLWESASSISAEESTRAGRRVRGCHMQAGYGAGWCGVSTGLPLRAVELACRTEGAHRCRFLLGHEDRLDELKTDPRFHQSREHYTVHPASTPGPTQRQAARPRAVPG